MTLFHSEYLRSFHSAFLDLFCRSIYRLWLNYLLDNREIFLRSPHLGNRTLSPEDPTFLACLLVSASWGMTLVTSTTPKFKKDIRSVIVGSRPFQNIGHVALYSRKRKRSRILNPKNGSNATVRREKQELVPNFSSLRTWAIHQTTYKGTQNGYSVEF